jgi:hypothetical protein
MTDGVELPYLYCPTCGRQFCDWRLHWDEEEFDLHKVSGPIAVKPTFERYLLCPNKHKWTVKMLWRSVNKPDRVLLGHYRGTE